MPIPVKKNLEEKKMSYGYNLMYIIIKFYYCVIPCYEKVYKTTRENNSENLSEYTSNNKLIINI